MTTLPWVWICVFFFLVFLLQIVWRTVAATCDAWTSPRSGTPIESVDLSAVDGIDLDYVEEQTRKFEVIGFKRLLDFRSNENPLAEAIHIRSFISRDGTVVAYVRGIESSPSDARDISFHTLFRQHSCAVTSNRDRRGPHVHRGMAYQTMPGCDDLKAMLARHSRAVERLSARGEEILAIRSETDLRSYRSEHQSFVMEDAAREGWFRPEGKMYRLTSRAVWRLYLSALVPLRQGRRLLWHLGVLGGGAIGAFGGLLSISLGLKPLLAVIVIFGLLAMFYGKQMGANATLWCLFVPIVLVCYATPEGFHLAGPAVAAAIVGVTLSLYLRESL